MQQPPRDLIIVVPAIMASVLQKDGRDVWAFSGQAAWQLLRSLSTPLRELHLEQDDWRQAELADGISAVRLIDLSVLSNMFGGFDYRPLLHALAEAQDTVVGNASEPHDELCLYAFPYDWRRDARATALRLRDFVDRQLPRWRAFSKQPEARVILIAHSFGGLVARYYVEVLKGWRQCRALVTLGTPHRGSVNILNTLSNGFLSPLGQLDLLVRTWTSIYQMLPVYPALRIGERFVYLHETDDVPHVDRIRATDAFAFHQELAQAAADNRRDPVFRLTAICWGGAGQDTAASAFVENGKLQTSSFAPPGLDAALADGDGTVSLFAMLPEGDHLPELRTVAATHAALLQHKRVINDLVDLVRRLPAEQPIPPSAFDAQSTRQAAAAPPFLQVDSPPEIAPGDARADLTRLLSAARRRAFEQSELNLVEDLEALSATLDAARLAERRGRTERGRQKLLRARADLDDILALYPGRENLSALGSALTVLEAGVGGAEVE